MIIPKFRCYVSPGISGFTNGLRRPWREMIFADNVAVRIDNIKHIKWKLPYWIEPEPFKAQPGLTMLHIANVVI